MKLLSLVSVSLVTLTATVSAFDRIIAYADSFTDNGNDYRNSQFPPSPPSYKGRFSNGPTWLEYVAKNLPEHAVINNGYGGATANNDDVYTKFNGYVVPGLIQQIETIPVNGTSKDLYVIYIGYNDLAHILKIGQYYVNNQHYDKEKLAENIVTAVKKLVKKYDAKQFLILNVPPFEQWPATPADKKAYNRKYINDYNALVERQLKKKVKGVDLKFLDDHSWFDEQLALPERLGLSTTNGPCSYGIGNTTTCSDPTKHFFWDSYHPEAKVHKALGGWATEQIKSLYKL
ncbi:Phosphatidylcholine-sterol acyltransferase [Choanephora cucurbitarum]|uniref:Phosphatidylcholine-sterol acyltransferase n=1 Tax=Choanephora cucurbitarum TaxID=101091 RepID=A0A1C7NE39_9FUNG|nr:Phosphatidylcholine-sterol acyltransferase [Choanephora cucurbitarum]